MPTTITSLLLLVVILLPGFAYTVARERGGTERKQPPLRESTSVVVISVFSELGVLIATWPAWSNVFDIDRLLKEPQKYFQARPGLFVGWALGLLLLATAVAALAAHPRVRQSRLFRRLGGSYPHPSTVSAWWVLFESWGRTRRDASNIYVGCILDDGSYVGGLIAFFDTLAEDSPDRDLILLAPIRRRGAQQDDVEPYPVDAVCISARHIVTMFVTYPSATSSGAEGEEGEVQA